MTTITVAVSNDVLGSGQYCARLRLDITSSTATLAADEIHNSQRGEMTFDQFHGRELAFAATCSQGAACIADADKIGEIARRLQPMVDRVQAGMATRWDGSNTVGTYTEDADAAVDDISWEIDNLSGEDWLSEIAVWDATEWLGSTHEVTAETTDDEIAEMATRAQKMATDDGIALTYGAYWGDHTGRADVSDMVGLLRAIREDMQTAAAEDDLDGQQ